MRRSDRLLGILLRLSNGEMASATELAERFEVSVRTIYRDMDALSLLGVPVYAEPGRGGGFRLLEGYFLPLVMFTEEEAISIVLGLTVLRNLRSQPFAGEQDTAESKLLAAIPGHLRETLANAPAIIGFESLHQDAFHTERATLDTPTEKKFIVQERHAIDTFLRAILDQSAVTMHYRSPYRPAPRSYTAEPLGLFWDRDCWYLIGRIENGDPDLRIWRADRVLEIDALPSIAAQRQPFDVRDYLDRIWLKDAMQDWSQTHPVRVLMTAQQAERLQQDWYYRTARFEERSEGKVEMIFGQNRPDIVMELLRWLGPGAELLEPREWRSMLSTELFQMLAVYGEDSAG